MGTYLNPGNTGFSEIRRSTYVDKTGLIGLINNNIDTYDKLICVSRPRRFGKSYAAQMIGAYYDNSCDSEALFNDLKISESSSFTEHLNKYDVIYIDMAYVKSFSDQFNNIVSYINNTIMEEIRSKYPGIRETTELPGAMIEAAEISGNKFLMIIDEWDAPIRENPKIQGQYLDFLRTLFKNKSVTSRIFAAVYMTGILPIKKDGSQSALSDFNEYTMVDPGRFAEFTGFTEEEVGSLCKKNNIDLDEMKQWYDGYKFENTSDIYNPNSVMKAIEKRKFTSYWTQSSATDNLFDFINMDFEGLSKTVTEIVGGVNVKINPYDFANDLSSFDGANSVLVALVHLGYLGFVTETDEVFIPNDEIRMEFARTLGKFKSGETLIRVKESIQLIMDTVQGNEEAVASQIEKIHMEETARIFYNNEQALRSIVKLAYFAYKDYYMNFEELPSGQGYADIVYFPKKDTTLPALIIELKWNKTAEGAIAQIKDKRYPEAIKDYGGKMLLVGINYDEKEKKHTCKIEELIP